MAQGSLSLQHSSMNLHVLCALYEPSNPSDEHRAIRARMQEIQPVARVRQELLITWRLLYANAREGLVLPVIGMLARFLPTPDLLNNTPWLHLSFVLLKTVFLFICHLYVFEIVNQVTSVEEDKVNKPHRPIPSGLLTVDGGHKRWWISWIVCPLLAYYLAGSQACYLFIWYQLWTFYCYVWPKFNHFMYRNAFASVGVYNMFRLIDEIIYSEVPSFPLPPTSFYLFLSAWVMLTVHMQEFHDSEGDKKTNRLTLPIIVGPAWQGVLRWTTAFLVIGTGMIPLAITSKLSWDQHKEFVDNPWIYNGTVITAVLHLAFAILSGLRCALSGGKEAYDRKTYKRFYMLAAYTMVCYLSFVYSTV
jgi:4-hydroxybenzoate polyprenyltransferase